MTSISIPNSVTSIGNGAFLGCSGLTSVIIPESVPIICYMAFSECPNIKKIVCNATTPPSYARQAFGSVSKYGCVLLVPEGTETLYKEAAGWKDFLLIENIPSAIEQVASPSDSTGDIYDLNGRLVRTQAEGMDGLMPGIYIKNGNKFVVK